MALHKTVLTELGNRHCIRLGKHFCPPLARRITLSIRILDRGEALIQKFHLPLVCHYMFIGETRATDQVQLVIFFPGQGLLLHLTTVVFLHSISIIHNLLYMNC